MRSAFICTMKMPTKISNISIFPTPLGIFPIPFTPWQSLFWLFSLPYVSFAGSKISYKWNHIEDTLYVPVISCGIMAEIHPHCCVYKLFIPFHCWIIFIIRIYHNLLICSVDDHFGYFFFSYYKSNCYKHLCTSLFVNINVYFYWRLTRLQGSWWRT